jgi:hypothetical protein
MMRREVAPLWRPELVGSLDVSQFDKEFTTMPLSSPPEAKVKLGICFRFVLGGRRLI